MKEKIRKIYDNSHQNYGAPKIAKELRKAGEVISERTVGIYMRQIGIRAHLYSRKIVAWTLSKRLDVSCVVKTITKAKERRNITSPLLIHSDRGSQYVADEYKKATKKIQRSYSKKAYPWDNACIESFHALIK
ncbi:IS3 family transposase [Veillonella magna]|uniref:IS3 family transposase n=1 Tax=Veillonella magna TaxID=464322 RepID=UPI0030B8AC34